jgi:cyclase
MLRKRIIFSLIYSDGFFMQSRNFRLQKVGNLNWLEKNYKFSEISTAIDELIILNASREKNNIIEFSQNISGLVKNVFIPIAAGGGIRTFSDAVLLFKSGADKIIINSLLYDNPAIVKEIIKTYGSQSVLASVDCKYIENTYSVYINNGFKKLDTNLNDYVQYIQNLGVGEIYLNSIDKDGTGFGYDKNLIETVSENITIPLIIAGGAGNAIHFSEGLKFNNVSGVATANLFNFIGDGLPNARKKLIHESFNLADWNSNKF